MAAKKKVADLKSTGLPADYPLFLESLKSRVQQSQKKAMLSVNQELIQLYCDIGRQIAQRQNLEGCEDDFYIDLLFYHLKLRCFVVIDLKMKKFTPGDAGQLNFYLSAVDSQMKHPTDQPTIGLILCKMRDQMTAEYALRDINKPIGVAEWQTKLVQSLPDSLTGSLPSIEQIEAEFADGDTE